MPCAFCLNAHADGEYDRIAGQDVCGACSRGEVFPHLRARGYEAHRRYWMVRDGGQDVPVHHQEIHITLPVDTGLTIRCVRERWYHALVGLLRSELQVGDPLFDDHIYVAEGSSAAVSQLLAIEGIQSAILSVGVQGTFILEGNLIKAHIRSTVPPAADDLRTLSLELAGAALHIEAWQKAR